MGVEYICDGCGKREPADNTARGFFKPYRWLQRGDENGTQVVCSRECAEKTSTRDGRPVVIAPF